MGKYASPYASPLDESLFFHLSSYLSGNTTSTEDVAKLAAFSALHDAASCESFVFRACVLLGLAQYANANGSLRQRTGKGRLGMFSYKTDEFGTVHVASQENSFNIHALYEFADNDSLTPVYFRITFANDPSQHSCSGLKEQFLTELYGTQPYRCIVQPLGDYGRAGMAARSHPYHRRILVPYHKEIRKIAEELFESRQNSAAFLSSL